MQPPHTCPDVKVLERLILGDMTDTDALELERHVENCSRCGDTLRQLTAEDTLTAALREKKKEAPAQPRDLELVASLISHFGEQPGGMAAAASSKSLSRRPDPANMSNREATAASSEHEAEIGWLGPYRILKVLGAGSVGVVYKAEDPHGKRLVALKTMLPSLGANASAKKRFKREAQAMAAIKHDCIVTIYKVGEEQGVPYLAMPFLAGETLEIRLKRDKKLPLQTVLRVGWELAAGLSAAHERSVIHRDIKPANIWLEGTNGRVKILDFGLARAADEEQYPTQSGSAQAGSISGTPAYMSPEQAQCGTVDYRCDLFSLGCVLYRMCTGQLPFKGKDNISTLLAVSSDAPSDPKLLDEAIPEELSTLVMDLLAKDPAKRPQSAVAVLEAIETIERKYVDPQQLSGRPARRAPQAMPTRRRWPVVLAAAVVLGLLTWGAAFLLRTPTAP